MECVIIALPTTHAYARSATRTYAALVRAQHDYSVQDVNEGDDGSAVCLGLPRLLQCMILISLYESTYSFITSTPTDWRELNFRRAIHDGFILRARYKFDGRARL